MSTAAIYFHPEAYTTALPKVMGRNAAGESFLKGLFAHGTMTEFWIQVESDAHARTFQQIAREALRNDPVKAVTKASLSKLSEPGAVFHPGPGIGGAARERALFGHGQWSLCGVTHTTSSARAMDAITDLITAPVQLWDAVICTSFAARQNVLRILQAQGEYLKQRLGIQRIVLPQLPVIPLGIHTKEFSHTETQKAEARSALGVAPSTHVVLFMGRLSFHAKAHPLAMYQALEAAAMATGKDVLLIECGRHPNEPISKAFDEAATHVFRRVRARTLDSSDPKNRRNAWAAADIFCSLSDNIQETFGLTPLEAMAAGLPVIVSDWNGYRDTVRHGLDGFCISTSMPEEELGNDLARRHALEIDSYDMYCGHTCSLISVDIPETTQAFVQLLKSPALRKSMGDSGRERALSLYDWKAVIPQYEALWRELGHLRREHAARLPQIPHPWPARMDPFAAFSGHSTRAISGDVMLSLAEESAETALQKFEELSRLSMVNFAKQVIPNTAEVSAVLHMAASGPKSAAELVQSVPAPRRTAALRGLCWLLKIGLLQTRP